MRPFDLLRFSSFFFCRSLSGLGWRRQRADGVADDPGLVGEVTWLVHGPLCAPRRHKSRGRPDEPGAGAGRDGERAEGQSGREQGQCMGSRGHHHQSWSWWSSSSTIVVITIIIIITIIISTIIIITIIITTTTTTIITTTTTTIIIIIINTINNNIVTPPSSPSPSPPPSFLSSSLTPSSSSSSPASVSPSLCSVSSSSSSLLAPSPPDHHHPHRRHHLHCRRHNHVHHHSHHDHRHHHHSCCCRRYQPHNPSTPPSMSSQPSYRPSPQDQEAAQEDASELEPGRPYHWHDWCVVRSRDCLYLWTESCALELSNGSNGWFRFILDGKLATMYSSGSPEGGSDSSGEWTLYRAYTECENAI